MRALTFTDRRVALANVPAPGIDRECRIRVRLAGICGTDLQLLEGYADFSGIPGHEFVGIVEETSGAEDASWRGKRVVGEINVGCGACEWCVNGVKEHCPRRSVLGIRGRSGAFAEYLSLPAANLHEVPAQLEDAAAVFVEPTAAACRILEQIDLTPRSRVAVIGDGRLGLIAAQVLRTTGATVMVVGKHPRKIEIARTLGLRATAASDATASVERFDVVVEATGRPEGLARALENVHPRGTIVLKSTFYGDASCALWPAVVGEVNVIGSRCGPFRPAIELLARGQVQVKPLVSRVLPLEEFQQAFASARRDLKVMFRP